MSLGLIMASGGSTASSTNGPSLDLWIPPVAGAGAAVLIVLIAGYIAWKMSNRETFGDWIVASVYAGPAWTAKDSWITNIAGVGAILGTIVTDSGSALKTVILTTPAAGITLLFLVFGGMAALAPIVYGATAKIESQGVTDTQGSVWGFLLAGAVSIVAVLGEMATMGVLVWGISDSTATKWTIVIALGLGATAISAYSIRSLMYFATIPAPRPIHSPKDSALGVNRSLLGNRGFSATL